MGSSQRPSSPRSTSIDPAIVVVGLLILGLDQLAKYLVVQGLGPGAARDSVDLLGGVFRLTYATNTGAAFGMFPERTIIFTAVAILAVPLLLFSQRFIGSTNPLVRFSLGLLFGGTLGNLIDRVRLGHVVDFVDMGIGSLRFPWLFNIADSSFVIGVAILAVFLLFWAEDAPRDSEVAKNPSP